MRRDVIVIGGSAGAVEAMISLVARLPPDLAAAIFVTVHFPSDGTSVLPRILSRSGPIPAVHARHGDPVRPGKIYVAPPDHHLLLDGERMLLTHGPTENGHRPAIDPLFRTAARAYGRRLIAVLLTGGGDDGTAGMLMVKRAGGLAVVQDPADAFCPSMPRSASEVVQVDHSLPLAAIPSLLIRLVGTDLAVERTSESETEAAMGTEGTSLTAMDQLQAGEEYAEVENSPETPALSGFSCPDCGGRLWELQEPEMLRFRCRVGHAYSPDSLLLETASALEGALWAALNALEESAALARRLGKEARHRNHELTAARFEQKAHETERQAALIRESLVSTRNISTDPLTLHAAEEGRLEEENRLSQPV